MDSLSPPEELDKLADAEAAEATTVEEACNLTKARVERLVELVENSNGNFVTDETRILVWKICRSYNDWPAWRPEIGSTLHTLKYPETAISLIKQLFDLGPAANDATWKFSMNLLSSIDRFSSTIHFQQSFFKDNMTESIVKILLDNLETVVMFLEHLSAKELPEDYPQEKWALVKVQLTILMHFIKIAKMAEDFKNNKALKIMSALANCQNQCVQFQSKCFLPFLTSSEKIKTDFAYLGECLRLGNEEALKEKEKPSYNGMHFTQIATSLYVFLVKYKREEETSGEPDTYKEVMYSRQKVNFVTDLIMDKDQKNNNYGSVLFRSFCKNCQDYDWIYPLVITFAREGGPKAGNEAQAAKASHFIAQYEKWWKLRNEDPNAAENLKPALEKDGFIIRQNEAIKTLEDVRAETELRVKFLKNFAELSPADLLTNETQYTFALIADSYHDFDEWNKYMIETSIREGITELSVKYLTECFEKGVTIRKYYFGGRAILSLLWNFTDASEPFRLAFAKAGGVKLLMDYLAAMVKKEGKKNPKEDEFIFIIVNIVYNLTRSIELKTEILECNAVSIFKEFMGMSELLKSVVVLSFAHILSDTPEATKIAVEENVVPAIMRYVNMAMEHPERKCIMVTRGGGSVSVSYSLEELAEGLALLAANDSIKDTLIENGICKVIDVLLKSEDPKLEAIGVDLVWTMSFQVSAREKIINGEEKLIDSVKFLSTSTTTSADIRRNATKTLAFIENWQKKVIAAEATNEESGRKSASPGKDGHVFISYSWKQQSTVLQIKAELVKRNYKVWMDVDKMHGDLLEAMAEAVEKASVVLICFSSSYKQSNPCRTEAQYAHALCKPIVPVNMEYHYFPDGWLGILVRSRKFVDMSLEKRPFDVAFEQLLSELKIFNTTMIEALESSAVALGGGHSLLPPRTEAAHSVAKRTFSSWKHEDLQEWLKNNKFSNEFGEILADFDGEMLTTLCTMKSTAPEFYYKTVSKYYQGHLPNQLKFLGLLNRIFDSA